MSTTAISSAQPSAPPPAPSPAPAAARPASTTARAADGDYLARSSKTAQTKDADGDYKANATAKSPAASTSSPAQSALATLKLGG